MRHRLVRFLFDHRSLPQRVLRRFAPEPIRVDLPDFRLFVRLDDWAVGARIAVKRSYEPHVTRVLRSFLAPGMSVIDVGANIGYFSMLAASRVGPGGRVLAFDPSPGNVDLLNRSAAANGFTNIETCTVAVADEPGTVTFSMDDSNGGIQRGEPGVSAVFVPAVALDRFLPPEQPIDLVKIDIEGCEGLAVRGMRNLLARHRPVVVTEFTPAALPRFSRMSAEEYLDLLRGLGYALRVIPLAGELAPPQDNPSILRSFVAARNDHVDLLATPTS